MTTVSGLARQVHAIRMKVDPPKPPVENFLDSEEWPRLLAVLRRVLPAYPESYAAVEQAIAGMVPPMGAKQVEDMICKAIWHDMDARIELAEALMELSKQKEGG